MEFNVEHRMSEAVTELRNAQDALAQASVSARAARMAETDCINRVNTAQQEIDKLMTELKRVSDCNTEWGRRNIPQMVPVSED